MRMLPDAVVFPRSLDKGRLKADSIDISAFTPEQCETLIKFSEYLEGKYFIACSIFGRWSQELSEKMVSVSVREASNLGAQMLGYRNWREMQAKRCNYSHLQIRLTKTRKAERKLKKTQG